MAVRMGKCPKCDKPITSVRVEPIDVKEGTTTKWKGASFCCPYCYVVLSVELDPLAMQADLVKKVKR